MWRRQEETLLLPITLTMCCWAKWDVASTCIGCSILRILISALCRTECAVPYVYAERCKILFSLRKLAKKILSTGFVVVEALSVALAELPFLQSVCFFGKWPIKPPGAKAHYRTICLKGKVKNIRKSLVHIFGSITTGCVNWDGNFRDLSRDDIVM